MVMTQHIFLGGIRHLGVVAGELDDPQELRSLRLVQCEAPVG